MPDLTVFVLGTMMGSAANALIDRLPKRESWFAGRSHCDRCGQVLEWYDLIPVVSYLMLGGRCRYCHSPIPFRNLLVEILSGMGFLGIFNFQFSIFNQEPGGQLIKVVILMLIFWVTMIITVMDWETKLVSETMVFVWAGLVLISQLVIPDMKLLNNFWGVICGVIVIGGVWAVSRGKAMGEGDVEIAAVLGWWLGWPNIAVALWVAFVSGAMAGVVKIILKLSKLKDEIAFGPFLVLGGWIAYFLGEKLIALFM